MIAIGYIHNGEVKAAFMDAVIAAMRYDIVHQKLIHSVIHAQSADIVGNRNKVVREFLTTPNRWLWFIDTDMVFPPDTLDRLLAAASVDRPVMAAMAFSIVDREAPYPVPVWFDRDVDGDYRFVREFSDTPRPLAGVGMACCLIHRSVFERLQEVYGADEFTWYGRDEVLLAGKPHRLGEDLTFCHRCTQLEIPIWGHAGVRTEHLKTTALGFNQFAAGNETLKESLNGSH